MAGYTVTKRSWWRSDYDVRADDGPVVGTLSLRGIASRGVARVGSESWSLRSSGLLRRQVAVVDGSGRELATAQSKRVQLASGRELEWKRVGRRGGGAFVDATGATVLSFGPSGKTTRVEGDDPDALLLTVIGTYLAAVELNAAAAVSG